MKVHSHLADCDRDTNPISSLGNSPEAAGTQCSPHHARQPGSKKSVDRSRRHRRSKLGPCVQWRARRDGNAGINGKVGNVECNLQNLKGPVGFESHPLRHIISFRINVLAI